jgi:hypothetical protein
MHYLVVFKCLAFNGQIITFLVVNALLAEFLDQGIAINVIIVIVIHAQASSCTLFPGQRGFRGNGNRLLAKIPRGLVIVIRVGTTFRLDAGAQRPALGANLE